MRASVIYSVLWFAMALFGGRVCPFLDDLCLPEWFATLLVGMIPVFIIPFFVERWAFSREERIPNRSQKVAGA